ncbi:hypothetical protein SAMN05444000_116102 [Shimia gijangensis]|uniref:Uncharacterized protein n=1 Tax=Shimia gijangensis TaxID=1470563 RepID=A0A1M6NTL7_9RHOB|nr:hypothetical protein SAMN05444000_116102 [Shimia gijangensis]
MTLSSEWFIGLTRDGPNRALMECRKERTPAAGFGCGIGWNGRNETYAAERTKVRIGVFGLRETC